MIEENKPEKVQLPLFVDKTQLPTQKNHVSFSELAVQIECGWRHKLIYIDQLGGDPPNQHTTFGHALHGAMEYFLFFHKTHEYNHDEVIENAVKELHSSFDEIEFKETRTPWENGLRGILKEAPEWLDKQYPGWVPVAAEFQLFEAIAGHKNKFFKGFIDSIIKYPKPPRKGSKPKLDAPIEWEYRILDWKGTDWGWSLEKKTDPEKRKQLVLYKHYICEKLGLDLKQVKCSFVLCKRKPKDGSHFELVEVSVGPETIKKALESLDKMLVSMIKKIYQKNRNSCTYCRFKNTKLCP